MAIFSDKIPIRISAVVEQYVNTIVSVLFFDLIHNSYNDCSYAEAV